MCKILQKLLGCFLALALLISGIGMVPAYAEGPEGSQVVTGEEDATLDSAEATDEDLNEGEEATGSTGGAAVDWPAGIEVTSESAIIMEAQTGAILYEKNADVQHYPASITKVLTTLLALENGSLDEVVTFSEAAVTGNEGDTSNISRDIGEQMTLKECLYAVMLESANECAYAVAEHTMDGDYQAFIDLMNEKARELGCTNSHFLNANGLPNEEHLTTCHDMALIARAAIMNDAFREITSTPSYQIPPTNTHSEITPLNNHHCMLHNYQTSRYLYDGCIGGKTGYTEAAGNTLVTFAERDGMTLICVVMRSNAEAQYVDTINLFNYCFANFKMCNVGENEFRLDSGEDLGGGLFDQSGVFAKLDGEAKICLPVAAEFNDTTITISYNDSVGNVVGSVNYFYGDHAVGTADVKTTGATVVPYDFGARTGGDADDDLSTDENEVNISVINDSWDTPDMGDSLFSKQIGPFKFIEWLGIAILAVIVIVIILLIRLLVRGIGGRRGGRRRGAYDRRYTVIKQNPVWDDKKKKRRKK